MLSLHLLCYRHTWPSAGLPAAPLLILLPANEPGKAMEGSPIAGPATTRETLGKHQSPGLDLAQATYGVKQQMKTPFH